MSEFEGLGLAASAGANVLGHFFSAVGAFPGVACGNVAAVVDGFFGFSDSIGFRGFLAGYTFFFFSSFVPWLMH